MVPVGALLGVVTCIGVGGDVVIHVSPSGDDAWTGALEAPSADGRDGPVATLARARDLVRAAKHRAGGAGVGAAVVIHGGIYRLEAPLVLTPEDSGDGPNPVTYRAPPGQRPVLSAGRALGPWEWAALNGRRVWAAKIQAVHRAQPAGAAAFRELYVNGARRVRARHPDRGYLQMEDVPDVPPGTQWMDGKNSFRFREADAPVWGAAAGADVVGFTRWIDSHLTVAGVDVERRVATFTRRAPFLFNPGDLYHLEGSAAFLDAPGEWHLDATAGKVYYVPLAGERIDDSPAVAPIHASVLELRGELEKGRFVEHVRFEGLTFAHAQWWFPPDFKAAWPAPEVMGFQQAAWGVPGAVRAEGARHAVFSGCTVEHVGGYGIELGRGCTENTISRCTITDLGAGGIKIGETTIRPDGPERSGRNTVEDCVITDGGHLHHQAVGVWIGQSGQNRIAHNRIAEFDYTGISIGWTWGYGPSLAGGNIVEFNEVCSLGARPGNTEPPLGDMAGIYTLGTQNGTVIRGNYFHDIAGRSIAWGIYFDEGSTGIVAENNLVLRTTHGSFHQHYGKDNIVRNNIFAYGRDAQLWRSRREEHTSFTLERNIVIADNDKWFVGDWSGGVVLEKNVYWRTNGQAVPFPGGKDLGAWLETGIDRGSVVAIPELDLSDPKNPVLGSGSAARGLGFVPFELVDVGPRPVP